MKKLIILFFLFSKILFAEVDTLKISYTSILSGFENEIFSTFEKKFNCKIESKNYKTSEELLAHKTLIKDKTDLVFGIDQSNYYAIEEDSLFVEIPQKFLNQIYDDYLFSKQNKSLPIAIDYLIFLLNSQKYKTKPTTFGQFQDIKFENEIILQDFKKSTIGKGCYFWILSLFRTSGYRHFWRSVQDNIHSFDNNIQSATNKFISGEASVLLTTFSRMQKIKNQYAFKEVIPDEGAFGIVYQVALTQFGEENNLSKKFLEFLLDRKIQIKLINKYNLVSALDSRRKVNSINCPSFNIDKSLNLNKKVLFEERERWLNYLQRIFE